MCQACVCVFKRKLSKPCRVIMAKKQKMFHFDIFFLQTKLLWGSLTGSITCLQHEFSSLSHSLSSGLLVFPLILKFLAKNIASS